MRNSTWHFRGDKKFGSGFIKSYCGAHFLEQETILPGPVAYGIWYRNNPRIKEQPRKKHGSDYTTASYISESRTHPFLREETYSATNSIIPVCYFIILIEGRSHRVLVL